MHTHTLTQKGSLAMDNEGVNPLGMYNIIASLVPRNPQNEAAFICPGNVIKCYTLHNQYTVRFNTACAHCAVITTYMYQLWPVAHGIAGDYERSLANTGDCKRTSLGLNKL